LYVLARRGFCAESLSLNNENIAKEFVCEIGQNRSTCPNYAGQIMREILEGLD